MLDKLVKNELLSYQVYRAVFWLYCDTFVFSA